ncbi:MAG TPA: ester cyclase, partial [Rubrobacter sp.]
MSAKENERMIRRIYDELWNERRLEVADEIIAEGGTNYDTGLLPMPFGPEEMKGTFLMVTAAFPDNRHEVEDVVAL